MVTMKVERADAYDLWGLLFSDRPEWIIFLSSTEKAFDVNRVVGTLRRIPCYGELIPCSRKSVSLFRSI